MKKIKTVLVANRGEIAIRVMRACNELGIRTVAIYSQEDVLSLHRYKADETYLIGEGKGPVEAYLDIEGILRIANENHVDAIHPGYGFLAENAELAKRCREAGLIFIGPELRHLTMFGDKINARIQAKNAGIPMIPGSDGPVDSLAEVERFAAEFGYPLMIKAVLGGGGRGMRVVRKAADLVDAYNQARSEAKAAFGNDEIYLEKLLEEPRHIEVQILGDQYGNVVHLFERDCSVQRRHQKLVEVAPAILAEPLRLAICEAAVKLMASVGYVNAGTVEFLVTPDQRFYFIEVNPRVQVEHTITEMVTGIDIVQSQLLIADGYALDSEEIGIPSQSAIHCYGHAIQCRVTTEDPANQFLPDTGRLTTYRSGGGFGLRLDGSNAYAGSVITPYYDSLLVKAVTWGMTRKAAIAKMLRCLSEFRIRGVKTNIPFLENVVGHEKFLQGTYDTSFVDTSPELFVFPDRRDRATKLLKYLGNITVNGYEGLSRREKPAFQAPRMPEATGDIAAGTKQILDRDGAAGLAAWIKGQKKVLLTDTSLRDAHQSLLATRLRTKDMLEIIDPTVRLLPNLFSLEMWGGATFDVAYRFLHEDPWERLALLRERTPNLLFQMLLRSANAVGYTNYPDNVVRRFVAESAAAGVDVFRIFDSLNWLEGMQVAIDAVRETGKVAEAALCYTGDILNPVRSKYDLNYYVTMARKLERAGANILGIKDMAGLLKPEAAYRLVAAIKDAVDLPVHLHTHDTSGNGVYMYARAIDAGVDIVDVAISSLAGMTSQPSANSLYYALAGHERQPDVNVGGLNELSHYWEDVRAYYGDFDAKLFFPNPEVYEHEMPGGQYSNLKQQAKALGLEPRWEAVKKMYRRVNDLFGDIIKVTPSSKVVGDMALFMVENDLSEADIYEKGDRLNFPQSVVEFFEGQIGQPYQGFPAKLQKIVLKDRPAITCRPGELMQPVDFAAARREIGSIPHRDSTEKDLLAYALYPKVFKGWTAFVQEYGNLSVLDTPTFFYGMLPGEEIRVDIEAGKTLYVKLLSVGAPDAAGVRVVSFELNGAVRETAVRDKAVKTVVVERRKADPGVPEQVAATMSGSVVKVLVQKGSRVKKGTPLVATEAMKMETSIQAPMHGFVKDVFVKAGDAIESGDLLLELSRPDGG